MKRFTAALLFTIAVFGIGIAVTSLKAQSGLPISADQILPSLDGKSVVVERDGWHLGGVKQNVHFVPVGSRVFLSFPMTRSESETYNYWMPIDKIDGLKVFDQLEDAQAYYEETSPFAKRPENTPVGADATSTDR